MESKTKNILSEEQLHRYERDGFLFPIKVLDPPEVSKFRSGFEELESHFGGRLEYAALTHLYFSWAYDLATRRSVIDRVEEILGEDILIQSTLILCKYPYDPAFVAWHQDVKYTNRDLCTSVSAWVALSDSTPDSGCMRVIPRSHRQGERAHTSERAPYNLVANSLVANSLAVDEAPAEDVVLGAGEMSLHHADLVHGSAPNRSSRKRIGFIIRFVTPDYQRTENPVIRARGHGKSSHLTFWDGLPKGSIEENISAWMEFGKQRNLIK